MRRPKTTKHSSYGAFLVRKFIIPYGPQNGFNRTTTGSVPRDSLIPDAGEVLFEEMAVFPYEIRLIR